MEFLHLRRGKSLSNSISEYRLRPRRQCTNQSFSTGIRHVRFDSTATSTNHFHCRMGERTRTTGQNGLCLSSRTKRSAKSNLSGNLWSKRFSWPSTILKRTKNKFSSTLSFILLISDCDLSVGLFSCAIYLSHPQPSPTNLDRHSQLRFGSQYLVANAHRPTVNFHFPQRRIDLKNGR